MKITPVGNQARQCQNAEIRPWLMFGLAAVLVMIAVAAVVLNRILVPDEGPTASPPGTEDANSSQPLVPVQNADAGPVASQTPISKTRRELAESDLIKLLGDVRSDVKDRRDAARLLARSGTPEALTALKSVLKSGPASLKGVVAESLAGCPNPEARRLLRELVDSPDEATARGAIRGWGSVDNEEAVQVLSNLLSSGEKSENLRSEAAQALGEMHDQPGAYAVLTNTVWKVRDADLATSLLEGLSKRPLAETQGFFETYLATPDLDKDLRLAAIEALGGVHGDPATLLMRYAGDSDAEVRAGVAWALSSTESKGRVGAELLQLLQSETEPEVRLRLYQALGNQETFDAKAVIQMVQQETKTDVRIGALDLLAQACQEQPTSEALAFFNDTGVASLTEAAISGETAYDRLTAVQALQRAKTPQSLGALEQISRRSTDPKVVDAVGKALRSSAGK